MLSYATLIVNDKRLLSGTGGKPTHLRVFIDNGSPFGARNHEFFVVSEDHKGAEEDTEKRHRWLNHAIK